MGNLKVKDYGWIIGFYAKNKGKKGRLGGDVAHREHCAQSMFNYNVQ